MSAPVVGSSGWLAVIRAAGRRCQCTACGHHKGRCPRVHMMAAPLYAVEDSDRHIALCGPCKTTRETPQATRPPTSTGRRNTNDPARRSRNR